MCRYVRKCIECEKIIYLSFDRSDPKCYECTVKRDETQIESFKIKCPCCGHEWKEETDEEEAED
jgi:hypothetical protein